MTETMERTETTDVLASLTQKFAVCPLEDLEAQVDLGLRGFIVTGCALMAIRDRRLFEKRGFSSMSEYTKVRFRISIARASELVSGAETALKIMEHGVTPPPNERVVRALRQIKDDEQRAEVWKGMVDKAGDADKITAHEVSRAIYEASDKRPISPERSVPEDPNESAEESVHVAARDAADRALSAVRSATNVVNDYLATEHGVWTRRSTIEAALRTVMNALKAGRAVRECYPCNGAGCEECRDSGWLPKYICDMRFDGTGEEENG